MQDNKKCCDCGYLDTKNRCHRYAPIQSQGICVFPTVSSTIDWCGDFIPDVPTGDEEIDFDHLPVRIGNIFHYYDIKTYKQLCGMQATDLLKYKNFGRYCLIQLERHLLIKGLSLKA